MRMALACVLDLVWDDSARYSRNRDAADGLTNAAKAEGVEDANDAALVSSLAVALALYLG